MTFTNIWHFSAWLPHWLLQNNLNLGFGLIVTDVTSALMVCQAFYNCSDFSLAALIGGLINVMCDQSDRVEDTVNEQVKSKFSKFLLSWCRCRQTTMRCRVFIISAIICRIVLRGCLTLFRFFITGQFLGGGRGWPTDGSWVSLTTCFCYFSFHEMFTKVSLYASPKLSSVAVQSR